MCYDMNVVSFKILYKVLLLTHKGKECVKRLCQGQKDLYEDMFPEDNHTASYLYPYILTSWH